MDIYPFLIRQSCIFILTVYLMSSLVMWYMMFFMTKLGEYHPRLLLIISISKFYVFRQEKLQRRMRASRQSPRPTLRSKNHPLRIIATLTFWHSY
ncbi:hypothetical protein V8C37DRAFT_383688 [Trichoderma ceciliae]